MKSNMPVPCAGKWDLFDSSDFYDHLEAREICANCPAQLECATLVIDVKREGGIFGQPEGTWAGQLLVAPSLANRREANRRRSEAQREADEAAYDDDQARIAHSQYQAGIRNEWTLVGHRVYQRRSKRRQRSDGAA